VFDWLAFRPGFVIYIHAPRLDYVLVCWWSLIFAYSFNMSSSPASPSLHRGTTANVYDDARKEGSQIVRCFFSLLLFHLRSLLMGCFWGYCFIKQWCTANLVFSRLLVVVVFGSTVLLSLLLVVVVRWLDSPSPQSPFVNREGSRNRPKNVCTDYLNETVYALIILDIDLYVSIFVPFQLGFLQQWLLCYLFWPNLSGVIMLTWLILTPLGSGPYFSQLQLHCLGIISVSTILTPFCFWWQVSLSPIFLFQDQYMGCLYLFCLGQHVYMLCLHPWMLDHPFSGGWVYIWLRLLSTSNPDVIFDYFLPGTFPLFLLSLPLTLKFAPTLVVLYTSVCWHLECVQPGRDEVRGKSSFVYDEALSETKLVLLNCLLWSHLYVQLYLFLTQPWTELGIAAQIEAEITRLRQFRQIGLPYIIAIWCNIKPGIIYAHCRLPGAILSGLNFILIVSIDYYLFGRTRIGLPRSFVL